MQTASAGGDEMESVKSYFNGTGFERWNKIYGETDEVNKVRFQSTTVAWRTVMPKSTTAATSYQVKRSYLEASRERDI